MTAYPVKLPSKANRDWREVGGVKWVDLCLRSERSPAWCWFEFKVRHVGRHNRSREAALDARDAFRKDVVALMGFDAEATADTWVNPDKFTKAYWFNELQELAPRLRSDPHQFVAAFLQLGGELDMSVWGEKPLTQQVREWLSYRSKHARHQRARPGFRYSAQMLGENYSLVVCDWSALYLQFRAQFGLNTP